MHSLSKPIDKIGSFLIYLTLAALASYFIFSATQGDFGSFKRAELHKTYEEREKHLAELQEDYQKLSIKTKYLKEQSLDLDLLDEQSRKILGYLNPDEVIIE